MSRWAPGNEEPVSFNKFAECVTDRVAGSPDADSLHHAGVAKLATAEVAIEHFGPFELVGFDAANEERLAGTQRPHEGIQRPFELSRQGWRPLPRLRAHGNIFGEQRS